MSVVSMLSDNDYPGPYIGPASLGGIPSLSPGIQGEGIAPFCDVAGGHMTQADPPPDCSLSLAQPFDQESACHPSQRESSEEFS